MRKAGDGNVSWRVSVWAEPRPQSTCHKTTLVRRKNTILASDFTVCGRWIFIKHKVSTEFRVKGLPQQGRSP